MLISGDCCQNGRLLIWVHVHCCKHVANNRVSRNLCVCLNEQQAGISLFQRVVNLKQNKIKCDPQLSVPQYDL